MMIFTYRLIACAFLVSAMFACNSRSEKGSDEVPGNSERPNIIFILVDDLGYGDIGCFGQEKIQTPAIDRLAGEGIRFTEAYADV